MSGRSNRTRAQIWAEGALAAHPYKLELRGRPDDLEWPQICAHCGDTAAERIVVKKAFRPLPSRHGRNRGMRPYRITAASIPFCATCAAEHRAALRPRSTAAKLMTLVFNPLMIPVIGAAWVAMLTRPSSRGGPLTPSAALLEWGLFGLMVAISAWSLFLLWETTRAWRLDPQTEVTRSCDFSADVARFFERERRIYALRNKAFADALAAQNANRAWTAEDQSRSQTRSLVASVLFLALIGGIVALGALTGR